MKIVLAPKAGFCFGVKRALDLVTKIALEADKPIFTLGPLIHNPQVVQNLSEKGIKAVNQINEIEEGVIVLRSHGVGPEIIQEAQQRNLEIIDATCPFVQKAQQLAKELAEKEYQVVVVGDKEHPEVTGIIGWSGHQGIVVETPEQAEKIPRFEKFGVICQTTQPEDNFNRIAAVLKEKANEVLVYNTICHATMDRQNAAVKLAKEVDAVIVVGGKNSANTQKLARLCTETGTPTYHIETASELIKDWLTGKNSVGLTAGASTPDWIIEEVKKFMEELANPEDDQKQLEEALIMKALRRGEVVKGLIVQVGDDEVMVDVGWKSEGIIPLRELSCCDIRNPKDQFKVGDEIEAVVINIQEEEGKVLLSKRKADAEKSWDILKDAMENNTVVEGLISEVVKGGLLVDVGVQGFIPASMVERTYVDDLSQYIGQTVRAKVMEVKREARKVILSRKALLEEENRKNRASLWQDLEEGQTRKGVVRRLTNFGAFVDLGGVDGLLHVSEMAWVRVGHPSEILKENDEIEVFLLNIDKEKEKISLSLKKIIPNPWHKAMQDYAVGKIVTGKVVRIAPFGAFVELAPGIDGLVHISQLSEKRISSPSEVLKEGEEVTAKIIEIDSDKRKIGLSIKELKKDIEKAEDQEAMKTIKQQEQPGPTLAETLGQEIRKKLAEVGNESSES